MACPAGTLTSPAPQPVLPLLLQGANAFAAVVADIGQEIAPRCKTRVLTLEEGMCTGPLLRSGAAVAMQRAGGALRAQEGLHVAAVLNAVRPIIGLAIVPLLGASGADPQTLGMESGARVVSVVVGEGMGTVGVKERGTVEVVVVDLVVEVEIRASNAVNKATGEF
jgi:hypothetical protein